MSLLMQDHIVLITVAMYSVLKLGIVSPLSLFPFSEIVLAILGPFRFHINFRTSVSVSSQKAAVILIGIALNLLTMF